MSETTNTRSQALGAISRLTGKFDAAGDEMGKFLQMQANGEQPDPEEFAKLLDKRLTAQEAMQAQFKLYEKPLKTVMTESK
jgi:hypothetical protein